MKIEKRQFLPKQHASVHASSICFHPNGHPIFAWFEGPREGHPNVFIRLYNLHGDEESILIGDKDAIPRWNPIVFEHKNRIYLFEKAGEFCDRWQTFFHDITNWTHDIQYKEIIDNAQFLPAGLNASVKTKPIIYENKIYCGSSVETIMDWSSYIECYTLNNGRISPYFRTNPLFVNKVKYQHPYNGSTSRSLGVIQPSLWIEDKNGTVKMHAFMRSSYGLGKIYHTKTTDCVTVNNFFEWDNPQPISIDNPNSSVDTVKYDDRLFLVCNPVKVGRLPLVVFELNEKMEPIDSIVITEQVEDNVISPEASYPYMIEKNGKLHLTYTNGRSTIEYVQISID